MDSLSPFLDARSQLAGLDCETGCQRVHREAATLAARNRRTSTFTTRPAGVSFAGSGVGFSFTAVSLGRSTNAPSTIAATAAASSLYRMVPSGLVNWREGGRVKSHLMKSDTQGSPDDTTAMRWHVTAVEAKNFPTHDDAGTQLSMLSSSTSNTSVAPASAMPYQHPINPSIHESSAIHRLQRKKTSVSPCLQESWRQNRGCRSPSQTE